MDRDEDTQLAPVVTSQKPKRESTDQQPAIVVVPSASADKHNPSVTEKMKMELDSVILLPKSCKTTESHVVHHSGIATVKLILKPSEEVITMACSLAIPLLGIKSRFATKFNVPVTCLLLTYKGIVVDESTTLDDIGVKPNGTVQLEVVSEDPVSYPLGHIKPEQNDQMPDVITVRLEADDSGEQSMQVVVEIERKLLRKRQLGGFRHRLTGVEYLNAEMQIPWGSRTNLNLDNAFCRDTQTVEQRHLRQQTFTDTATQMTGIGVYVSVSKDKLLEPGPYTLADDRARSILEKIIIIQKYYRRWLAIRKVNVLREAKRKREEWEKAEEERKQRERRERLEREFQRKVNPRTKEDFDLLYAALEKWRLEELERINASLTGAERKAELCMLLEKETDLLAAIDRHKMEAGTEQFKRYVQNFLHKTSAPKKWRGFKDEMTEMVTPYTLRAKELRDIYNTLNMKYLSPDERLDILLTLKYTVAEHGCTLTQDIIELIDREADLLMRGVKEDNLMGLRKRISTLFLHYLKTPTFNPEAANYIKLPQNPLKLRNNIFHCKSCGKMLPASEFLLSTNSRTAGHCRGCLKLDNIARPRLELSHFTRMLKTLRNSEEMHKDGSQFAFIMTETDIRYMVEYMWDGRSILSEWQDRHDLELVRWDKAMHWSPWNCIVLTSDEAESHEKIEEDLSEVSDD
ncbi:hypothetical protein ACOMHN_017885 [Nucella lapillus]